MMFGLAPPPAALADALQACRRHFVSAFLFSALLNLLYLAPMLYMLQVYDRVVPAQGLGTLILLTLVLVFALSTLALLDFVRSRLMVRASVRLERQLARLLLDRILERCGETAGALRAQALREFDALRQTLAGPAMIALFDLPWTPIYVLVCFLIHPWIGLFSAVAIAVLALLAMLNERATGEPILEANRAASRAYVSQEQSIAAAEAVRALGMRQAMVERHAAERDSSLNLQTSASFAGSRYVTLSKFARLAFQSLALGLGGWLAVDGKISAGAIFASTFLVGRALAPVDQVLGAWRSVVQARSAWQVLVDVLTGAEDRRAPTQLPPPAGRIAAEGLSVANATGDAAILIGCSFEVAPGQVVAIVGPSGAGKSTLLRMLAGAGTPTRGAVRIDGADARDWDPERLAPYIGYLPQEPTLFAGTVKENIVRFRTLIEADRAQLDADAIAAANAAGAHDMIVHLPKGYDSELGWGGRGVSAGQAQRIGLARAMFREPPILLLDEPNAHLDAEGEQHLLASLAAVKERGGTALVVAHRMGILGVVDKIMVMREGRIDAFGDRDDILGKIRSVPAPEAAADAQEAAG